MITITLAHGRVTPNGQKIDVPRGSPVVLDVTADHADEIHVHDPYDVELQIAAGGHATRTFVADQVGSVEIEAHHPEKIIAILNVR